MRRSFAFFRSLGVVKTIPQNCIYTPAIGCREEEGKRESPERYSEMGQVRSLSVSVRRTVNSLMNLHRSLDINYYNDICHSGSESFRGCRL